FSSSAANPVEHASHATPLAAASATRIRLRPSMEHAVVAARGGRSNPPDGRAAPPGALVPQARLILPPCSRASVRAIATLCKTNKKPLDDPAVRSVSAALLSSPSLGGLCRRPGVRAAAS